MLTAVDAANVEKVRRIADHSDIITDLTDNWDQ